MGIENSRTRLKQKIGGDGGYRLLHFLSRNILAAGLMRIWCGGNLNKLATFNNTDKFKSNGHNYTQHYSFHFNKLRHKNLNLLEIGIGGYKRADRGGCSLRMWKHYFKNAHIHGIDIYDKTPHNEHRIKTHKGSQVDIAFLDSVIISMDGKLDIIIDDGSHINVHVIETFKLLFPHLNDGGIYVIEDTETSYDKEYGGNNVDMGTKGTMMNFFKQVPDTINKDFIKNENIILEPIFYQIESIHFYKGLIFIYKLNLCY